MTLNRRHSAAGLLQSKAWKNMQSWLQVWYWWSFLITSMTWFVSHIRHNSMTPGNEAVSVVGGPEVPVGEGWNTEGSGLDA